MRLQCFVFIENHLWVEYFVDAFKKWLRQGYGLYFMFNDDYNFNGMDELSRNFHDTSRLRSIVKSFLLKIMKIREIRRCMSFSPNFFVACTVGN